MSTSGLGTLLASRLDAVLGVPQAQQAVKLDGKGSHAVSQPAQHIHGQDTAIRRAVEDVGARTAGEAAGRSIQNRGAAGEAARALAGNATSNPLTSARTQLSEPAQTILALLLGQLPNRGALQGFRPLLLLPLPLPGQNPGQSGAGGTAAGRGYVAGSPNGATAGNLSGAGTAAGAGATGNANARAGAAQAFGPGAGATATSASAAVARGGQMPAGMSNTTGGASGTGAAATSGLQATLPTAPTGMVSAMATALQQTVTQSGLFYESHLAQMAFGQRDPGEVAREPQARLPQPGTGSGNNTSTGNPGTPAANTGAGSTNPAAQAVMAGQNQGASGASGTSPMAQVATAQAASTAGTPPSSILGAATAAGAFSSTGSAMAHALAGIHPDAAPLVRQQLEALANQSFVWQGAAWQGVPMRWEVQRRPPGEEQIEALATWATRLNLQLPRLGNIEARLSLAGDRLVLRMVAPKSAPLLQNYLNVLRDRLSSQGLQLTDTAILQSDQGNPVSSATSSPGNASDPAPTPQP